jgi:hypothetical protein
MLTTRLVDNKFREYLNRFACPLTKIQDRTTIAKKVKQSRYRPGVAQKVPGS